MSRHDKQPFSIPDSFKKENEFKEIKHIYRGVWADELRDEQELPLGGSLFRNDLTTKLRLDFSSFDEATKNFTRQAIDELYEKQREKIESWLKQVGADIDPYLFFICFNIQSRAFQLMELDPKNLPDGFERQKLFGEDNIPSLSDMKGKAQCAELAAIGQYLMQKIGVKSSYMSGISMMNADDFEEFPADHSFLVVEDLKNSERGRYIFDIARPRSQNQMPRLQRSDKPLNYELFDGKKESLVKTIEVLQGGELYFGVGEPVAGGRREILE